MTDLAIKTIMPKDKKKKDKGDIVVLYNFFHKGNNSITIHDFVKEIKALGKAESAQLAQGIRNESYNY
jgi:hypothetical protein